VFDGITDHGLQVGDIVYINSTNGSFSSGTKTITARTTTTFDYAEVAANVGATANIGTVSFDSIGEATMNGSGAVATDFLRVLDAGGLITGGYAGYTGAAVLVSDQRVKVTSGEATGFSTGTVILWHALANASDFEVFAQTSQTATQIRTAVHALAIAANSKVPIDLTVLGAGTGTILESTPESIGDTTFWYLLADGINYVKTTTIPGNPLLNYTLTFKNAITSSLATGSDWAHEEVYIVPTTAKNVADWLNAPTVSGLFTDCSVQQSGAGSKVQIATSTAGSAGGVQVQGGLANSVTAALIGELRSTGVSSLAVSSVKYSDTDGLRAGMWCKIQNQVGVPKNGVFDSTTTLVSWAVDGTVTIGVSTGLYFDTISKTDEHLMFERQGRYVAITVPDTTSSVDLTTVGPGDYVRITTAFAPTSFLQTSAQNQGIYRIVRVDLSDLPHTYSKGTVWIENEAGVDETSECNVAVYSGNSMMPGDVLIVNNPIWGAANQGKWVVESVGLSGGDQFNSLFTFKVATDSRVPVAQGAVGALGALSTTIQVIEGMPNSFVMKITGITLNQDSAQYMDIRWDNAVLNSSMSAATGGIVSALDKLDFPLTYSSGVDGYSYNTGLIGEANKVVQGDPDDTSAYPGVAAAGARIDIDGPLVKRIKVSLSLRTRSGVANSDIAARVRSAVATFINQVGVGQPVALSGIVAAASKVVGVVSVVVVAPTYGIGNDEIAVQPAEKPLILSLTDDISVEFV
jgi:hypothetical protein